MLAGPRQLVGSRPTRVTPARWSLARALLTRNPTGSAPPAPLRGGRPAAGQRRGWLASSHRFDPSARPVGAGRPVTVHTQVPVTAPRWPRPRTRTCLVFPGHVRGVRSQSDPLRASTRLRSRPVAPRGRRRALQCISTGRSIPPCPQPGSGHLALLPLAGRSCSLDPRGRRVETTAAPSRRAEGPANVPHICAPRVVTRAEAGPDPRTTLYRG